MRSERDLRLLVGAVGLSAAGDFLALVPLALHVEALTGSGPAVAALFIALWSPMIVLAPLAGLLADRVESRRLLLWASVGQAVVAVALAFAASLPAVLALTALLGSGAALGAPAEFALVPRVAGGGDRLARANGRVEAARYLGYAAGPALGGLLAAGGGTRAALLVDAASFAAVAAVALALHARRAPANGEGGGPAAGAREGLAVLLRPPALRLVLAVSVVSLAFMTATATAEVFFAVDVLGAGEAGYGLLLCTWTAGMAIGSLALAHRVGREALAVVALAAIAIQGAGIALPPLWPVLGFALAAFALGGVAHGVKNVVVRTLIHHEVPERVHGRAFAAYNAMRNAAELGALLMGGAMVAALGPRWTMFVAGALPALAGLVGLGLHAAPRRAAATPGPLRPARSSAQPPG